MPTIVNTTPLAIATSFDDANDSRPVMVDVNHVSMVFNMASEQLNSIKEYVIAIAKRELMFKEFRALDDVSFTVRKGDVFGILGTNGSGKSTMLKVIAGVLEPSEGTCTINGNIAPLIELGAGFDMELTARENIYLNGALLGYSRKFIDEHFDEIVSFAEIEKFLDMPMKNYSSGMVARIAFAIATVIIPDILIVDEVLSVGDFMFQQKCEQRIQKLIKEHEATVLIVSHSNDQIERLCNKAIWIEKGHARMMGTASEVCRMYRLLGGHVGSQEAESKVVEMINRDISYPDDIVTTLCGDDRYSSAAKLTKSVPTKRNDIAILAPGDSISSCMLASSLSGLIGCPLLLTKQNSIPNSTADLLKSYDASNIIVVGDVENEAIKRSMHDHGFKAEISFIAAENPQDLSAAVYEFGRTIANDSWSKALILVKDGQHGDFITQLPYAYANKAPVLIADNTGLLSGEQKAIINERQGGKLLSFGISAQDLENKLNLSQRDITVYDFLDDGPYNVNCHFIEWQLNQADCKISAETALIASVWDPFDALLVGPYAAHYGYPCFLEDPQDLDSINRMFILLDDLKGTVSKLEVLGNGSLYTQLDKQILAKAVTFAKEKQGL